MENYENIRLPWQEWRVVKYLGGGGYGKVYEIERTMAGIRERAALKVISRPKDAGEMEAYYDNGYDRESITATYESEIQNYVQEYKLMKELQGQSNIVSCDDFTVVPHKNGIGGDIFIRMELLTSLTQVLRERVLSEKEIVKLGKDISRALILCESKKIIHRDIKPANIMISPFGDYKLGDFGVSKKMDHKTFATAVGTQEYLAPEVVHMEKYGLTADIYSLGITLYWLLNNRRMPFIDADAKVTPIIKSEAMERRYRGDTLPPPKNGSSALKKIVQKACEYRPEDRYASARELYEALDSLSDQRASGNDSPPKKSSPAKEKDIYLTLSIKRNELGRSKKIRVSYADGREKVFEIEIPATIKSGQSIRLKGHGMVEAGQKAGDLYLKIDLEEEPEKSFAQPSSEDSFGDASFDTIGNPGEKAQRGQKTYGAKQTESNSWGGSVGTIGSPGWKAQKKKEMHGADTAETVGKEFAGKKVAAKKQDAAKKQEKKENLIDGTLAKISVEQTTAKNVLIELVGYVLLIVVGGALITVISGLVGTIAGVFLGWVGLEALFSLGESDFKEWMNKNKEKAENIDDLIKNNPEFAKRLYYEKCPNKHLLKYMEKLNPTVVKEIKASSK